ncbi:hypothetical protein ACHAXH_001483 [Discostella pseudostelligera]
MLVHVTTPTIISLLLSRVTMANYSMVNSPMDSPDTVDLLSGGDDHLGGTSAAEVHVASSSTASTQRQQQQPSNTMTTSNPSSESSPFYQMDFDVEHVGKKKPQSKRVATWRYGMSVRSANGVKSIEQHEAKLVWSTHSGKYAISVDGEEVSAAVAKGSVLEHKWKWCHAKGVVVDANDDTETDFVKMRILACRKPPVRSSKNFRCYEFVIEGKVFRDLPFHGSSGGMLRSGGGGGEFHNEDMDEDDDNMEDSGCGADFNASSYDDDDDGKLTSILDVIEPGWRSAGFA